MVIKHLFKNFKIDRSVSVHMRNLQILAIDLFKVSRDLAPTICSELLKKSIQFNLQHAAQFSG